MALRLVMLSGGLRILGKPNFSNNYFVAKHPVSVNFVRCIRGKGHQQSRQGITRNNSTTPSPFDGFVEPKYIGPGVLGKTAAFTAAFTAGSFISVTIWEYEKIRSKAITALNNANPLTWMRRKQQEKPLSDVDAELKRLKKEISVLWNKLTPGEQVFMPILVINILVYSLWRVPRLKTTMLKYFCSNPAGKAVCWPMVLSTFSHYSLFHLFANMYVLHSFSAATNSLGREQFLGLYLSAGVISSFASYALKIVTANPGYSLGASGAIMGILAYTCAHFPETKLSILFLPQLQFSAGSAIQAVMAFDLAGLIFKWKLFDHAAHLGGACVGLFWSYYGQQHLWPLREHFVGVWHEFRGKVQK